MADRAILDRVKRATVALAVVPKKRPTDPRKSPFIIICSGFCVHPRGIIITCEHVLSGFVKGNIRELIDRIPDENKDAKKELWPMRDVEMDRPQALFFVTGVSKENLYVVQAPMEVAISKMDVDLAVLRVCGHAAFKGGYPTVEIEDFANVYEGMDAATLGFPLGHLLQDTFGTMTSSFTRGIVSSIAPSPGTPVEYVTGFQLDLTATNGNSGGPVFSWATGKVFSVLQGGLTANGRPIAGIARAEPVYRVMNDDTIDRVLKLTEEDMRRRMGERGGKNVAEPTA